ncbi:MAG: carboxylesterase family protein [Cyanobacteria bacterium J06642_11]
MKTLNRFFPKGLPKKLLWGAAAAAIAAGLSWFWSSRTTLIKRAPVNFIDPADTHGRPLVRTDLGSVLGYVHQPGVLRFSRIPFAAPPVGTLRFRPPQPALSWDGILDTRKPGPICIQRLTNENKDHPGGQSEDCLSLTISTPSLTEKRPVIVWLHGGGLANGGNHNSTYDGANFVNRGDVVFVNLQYRVGALGWLDVSPLDDDKTLPPGQLDVVAGLEWVQRNIEQFGGDPDNITLMGESAGAYLTASLLVLPAAQPLFHKAILQSGVYDVWEIPADRRALLQRVLTQTKATTLDDLQQLSPQVLQKVEEDIHQFSLTKGWPGPMPWYRPRGVTQAALETVAQQGKPILHGTLNNEFHLFLLSYGNSEPYEQLFKGFLKSQGLSSTQLDSLVEQIRPVVSDRNEQDVLVDLISAIYMHYPHSIVSEHYGANAPVYSYLINWTTPNFPELGAMHALDLPLVFGNFENWTWAIGENPPQNLSRNMQDAWIAFAKTGNPNHQAIPPWPTYNSENRSMMVFGENQRETIRVVDDPLGWVRELGPRLNGMISSPSRE